MAKILIVEDDPQTRQSLVDWLKSERYEVESAVNGVEAVDRLAVSDYDLVVLDWSMPVMDGIDVCKYMRDRRRDAAIIFLTARTDIDSVERGLDCGADDYLTKPFSLRQLSARVRALLRRANSPVQAQLACGDITLNPVNHVVCKGQSAVDLEPKEFAMLELLMKHQNELFTTDALIRRVWTSADEVSAASVRNCIRSLRKKLGSQLIENCYGQGYRLNKS